MPGGHEGRVRQVAAAHSRAGLPVLTRDTEVVVIVGGGAMGIAAARRCGIGRRVLFADVDEASLSAAASTLTDEGLEVTTQLTDVANGDSVAALTAAADSLGEIRAIVHTAGVSPVQAPADVIVAVDLVGVAHMLSSFGPVVGPGCAAVVIASMAGHLLPPLPSDDAEAIRTATPASLRSVPCVQAAAAGDAGLAYAFAKQGVGILIAAASVAWGRRGARINSISPGVIATPMGRAELESPSGELMRMMVDASGTQRLGTPEDIAETAEFLLGPAASFITGTDVLVDGGVVAAVRSGQLG